MSILLVAGDGAGCEGLAKRLGQEGYAVQMARDDEADLSTALDPDQELIILDVGGSERGKRTLSAVRRRCRARPVLVLADEASGWGGFQALVPGKNEWLPKPFVWTEFVARIQALAQPRNFAPNNRILVGDLEIDLVRMQASRAGRSIHLTSTDFRILCLFARQPGDTLSRSALAKCVWDMKLSPDSNVVDIAVSRLRRKVDAPSDYKLIHTVRGFGYRMAPPDSADAQEGVGMKRGKSLSAAG